MKIQGFYRRKIVGSKPFKTTKEAKQNFDGSRLDELEIEVSIRNVHDIEDLENFLRSAKQCFLRPVNDLNEL